MSQPDRSGWNLLSVIGVLAVVGLVVGMLIPATRRVRFAATRMQCSNNLKQLMLGVHSYESTGRPVAESPGGESGEPSAKLFPIGCVGVGDTPEERLSWMVALLPYLDQGPLSHQFNTSVGYADHPNAARTGVKLFLCPEGKESLSDATTHYVAMAGIGADAASRPAGADGNGLIGYDRRTDRAAIKDGLSNTIALMETRNGLGPWARGGGSTVRGFDPSDVPWCGDGRPFGGHTGGAQLAMADGSVRFIRAAIDPKQLAAAITIAGGDNVDLDW